MDKQKEFKNELVLELKEVLRWSKEFFDGKKNYSYDIDDKLFVLSEKYNLDFKKENYNLIYTLVDYFCDSVKHNFEEVYDNYPLLEARSDIQNILDNFQVDKDWRIYLPSNLEKKLNRIFQGAG